MAHIVDGIYASCVVCRSWMQKGVAMDHFNVVCPRCADAIVEAWLPESVVAIDEPPVTESVTVGKVEVSQEDGEGTSDEDAQSEEPALECPICGEVFVNRGKYLAHRKAHRKAGEDS